MPKLSIITINLNNSSGLRKTIESVVSQNFNDFEYIIIDGGSSDGSVDLINEFADKITFWVSESDKGIYDAMNKGIKVACGDYLIFLNSGDILSGDTILNTVSELLGESDIVTGRLLMKYLTYDEIIYPHKTIDYNVFLNSFIAHTSTFFHKSVFAQYGIYDTQYKIAADHALFYHIFSHLKVKYKPIDHHISTAIAGGVSTNYKYKRLHRKERKLALHTTPAFYKPLIDHSCLYSLITKLWLKVGILLKKCYGKK